MGDATRTVSAPPANLADARQHPAAPQRLDREALEAAQVRLLQTLLEGAPPPEGFDPQRLAAARTSLLKKKAHQAEKIWPRASFAKRIRFRLRRWLGLGNP